MAVTEEGVQLELLWSVVASGGGRWPGGLRSTEVLTALPEVSFCPPNAQMICMRLGPHSISFFGKAILRKGDRTAEKHHTTVSGVGSSEKEELIKQRGCHAALGREVVSGQYFITACALHHAAVLDSCRGQGAPWQGCEHPE